MNYTKIQNDIIKDLIKYPGERESHKRFFIGLARYKSNNNDFIAVLTQVSIYLIPIDNFYLDFEKITAKCKDFTPSIEKMLDIKKDTQLVFKSDKTINVDKWTVNIFTGDDLELFINKKYLAYFKDDNCYFRASDPRKALLIYSNVSDDLIGYILPINPNYIKK